MLPVPAVRTESEDQTGSSKLGKDKEKWSELTDAEVRAARVLGWHQAIWDDGIPPEICGLDSFQGLSPEFRAAAELLGYTQANWNAELELSTAAASPRIAHEWAAPASTPAVPAAASPIPRAESLRRAFELDPTLWEDLARLYTRVEEVLSKSSSA